MFCLLSQFAADIFTFLDNWVRNEVYSHELCHNWYGEGISMRQWWRNCPWTGLSDDGVINYQEDGWPLSIGQVGDRVVARCHGSVLALHKIHSLCTLSLWTVHLYVKWLPLSSTYDSSNGIFDYLHFSPKVEAGIWNPSHRRQVNRLAPLFPKASDTFWQASASDCIRVYPGTLVPSATCSTLQV